MNASAVQPLLQTLTYIDRANVSFAALQFKGDLHLSTQQLGLGLGTMMIPEKHVSIAC